MELYKRTWKKNGKKVSMWYVGEGYNKNGVLIERHTTKCQNKEAAQNYLDNVVQKLTEWKGRKQVIVIATDAPEAKGLTLVAALEKWLLTKNEETRQTLRSIVMRALVRPMSKQGVLLLADVKTPHVRALQQKWLDDGLSLNTIASYRASSNMYDFYIVEEQMEELKNPWAPIKMPDKPRLTDQQKLEGRSIEDCRNATLPIDCDGDGNWQAIRSGFIPYLRGQRYWLNPLGQRPESFLALVELMYETGLRKSDAIRFRPDWIDWTDPLHPEYKAPQKKTGNDVVCLLPVELAKKLSSLPLLPWRGTDISTKGLYPFWDGSCTNSKGYLTANVDRPLRKFGETIGFHVKQRNSLRPHRFRDSFAINLLDGGASMEDVSKALGHKDIGITQRYYDKDVRSRVKARLARLKVVRQSPAAPAVPAFFPSPENAALELIVN